MGIFQPPGPDSDQSDRQSNAADNADSSALQSLHKRIIERAGKDRENLRLFVTGAFVFFFGLCLIVFGNQTVEASVKQEIIVLCGLVVTVIGGACASAGYICLSIFRIIRILDKK